MSTIRNVEVGRRQELDLIERLSLYRPDEHRWMAVVFGTKAEAELTQRALAKKAVKLKQPCLC